MSSRRATAADAPAVVETLTGAFDSDPAWSWAFDDTATRRDHLMWVWALLVDGALRYDSVWMTDGAEAVTVWLPPEGDELSADQQVELDAYVASLDPPLRARLQGLFDAFEHHHPTDRPHHYLSLFGTHPDHRGKGLGMALLAEDLARIDALGEHAYLESTNPGNNKRYASAGFHVTGAFDLTDGLTVTTMWRDARATGG